MPNNMDFCTRAAAVSAKNGANGPSTIDEAARSVGFVLATENPVAVYDWQRGIYVDEVLLMSGATFPPQVPLLDSHNRYSVDAQLGSLRDLQVSGQDLLSTAFFADDPKSVSTFGKVRDRHLTDISVGYTCDDVLFIGDGESTTIDGRTYTGPLRIVRKWTVKEGSVTPIGADELAKVRSAMQAQQNHTPESNMLDKKDNSQRGTASGQPLPGASAAPAAADPNAGQRSEISTTPAGAPLPQAAPAASMTSGAGESSRTALANMVNIGLRHGCVELAEQYILEGRSLDDFRAAVLDRIGGQAERNAPAHHVAVGETDEEKFRAAAGDSIVLRSALGARIEKPAPGAFELRGYSLRELARECCRRSGMAVPSDPMEMIGRAFSSTSDFPAILGNSVHRSVLQGAQAANESFPLWTGDATATDFREHTGVALDAFSSLDETPEGAEIHRATTSDRDVKYRLATFTKSFSITRQAIINDDVNLFSDVPSRMGQAAMRTVGNKVFDFIFNNPQLEDGHALFSTEHGNLAAAGAIPGYASYKLAAAAMGKQTTTQGDALNIIPAFWLVPVSHYADAAEFITSTLVGSADKPNVKNPYYNAVTVIQDGRIDAKGLNEWFVFAAKGYGINVAWLNGNKTPRIEQRAAWTVEGVEFKVGIDAGVFAADWRGVYKNPGE